MAIHLAHDVDDVVGMAVSLGEYQRLGCFFAGRENLRFHRCFHGLNDLSYLADIHYGAVKLFAGVGGVFFGFTPALFTGLAVAVVYPFFGLDLGSFLGDFSFNREHVVSNVDTVGYRLFVVVFGHDVFIEEAEGTLIGGSGEANKTGIEIVQHLLPQVVDTAVALIDDDEVKRFDGHCRVVMHQLFLIFSLLHFVERYVFGRFVNRLATQDGVHALNGADTNLRVRVDSGRR